MTTQKITRNVPCNGCTLCCQGDVIYLHAENGDEINNYRTTLYNGRLILEHKADGSCFYLGAQGCTIHIHRPAVCRSFDCRLIVEKLSRSALRRLEHKGYIRADVLKQGRILLGRIKE